MKCLPMIALSVSGQCFVRSAATMQPPLGAHLTRPSFQHIAYCSKQRDEDVYCYFRGPQQHSCHDPINTRGSTLRDAQFVHGIVHLRPSWWLPTHRYQHGLTLCRGEQPMCASSAGASRSVHAPAAPCVSCLMSLKPASTRCAYSASNLLETLCACLFSSRCTLLIPYSVAVTPVTFTWTLDTLDLEAAACLPVDLSLVILFHMNSPCSGCRPELRGRHTDPLSGF